MAGSPPLIARTHSSKWPGEWAKSTFGIGRAAEELMPLFAVVAGAIILPLVADDEAAAIVDLLLPRGDILVLGKQFLARAAFCRRTKSASKRGRPS